MFSFLEPFFLRIPFGFSSRIRIILYRFLGMKLGKKNRFEKGRLKQVHQIKIGNNNAFTQGWFLWPETSKSSEPRIVIGDNNFFNRNLYIDACQLVEIGNENMFGPDIVITDSNHSFGKNVKPKKAPMHKGKVKIGNYCWIGTRAVILKDVVLGDFCVVAAGSVVTKGFPAGSIIGGIPAKIIKDNN